MLRKIAFVLAGCLLMSACTPIQVSPEELLRPPKLTDLQAQVYSALISSTGSNIKLKYPKSGDYRSAFTFADLNNDGQDEALVFYTLGSNDPLVRIKVLAQEEGTWQTVYDMNGGGNNIEFVRFATMTSTEGRDIVIGWEQLGNSPMTVSVYRYRDKKLLSLYSDSYTAMAIANFDGTPLEEMVLFESLSNFRYTYVRLIHAVGSRLEVANELEVTPNIIGYHQIATGNITPGQVGIVLDATLEDEQTATFFFSVDDGKLRIPYSSPAIPEDDQDFSASARPQIVLSRDIDKDGVIEIPTQTPLPGYEDMEDPQYLTHFWQASENGLVKKLDAYVNVAAGYMVAFPPRWAGQVSAVRQEENGEIEFFRYVDTLQNRSIPLLRIRVYSQKDYQDNLEMANYQRVARKGIFSYYAYIPPDVKDDLNITEKELADMFSLLS